VAFSAGAVANMLAREEASSDADPLALETMRGWLQELRRLADIKPSPKEVQAQTRERRRAAEGPS
jgi:hypothetical protein